MTRASNARRSLLSAALVCLALLGLTLCGATRGNDHLPRSQDGPLAAVAAGAHFAFADFDGDRQTDLATVQVVPNAARVSRYSIHFRLSTGPESAVDISAPFGGLQVVPKDVNGDEIADLIVTTALDARFVAVLLNDGHGNFTLAEPGAYPALEVSEDFRFSALVRNLADCTSLAPSRNSSGTEAAFASEFQGRVNSEVLPRIEPKTVGCFTCRSPLGRSPPAAVPFT